MGGCFSDSASRLSLSSSSFSSCSVAGPDPYGATYHGGGLALNHTLSATLSSLSFTNCSAGSDGGGVHAQAPGPLTVSACSFSACVANNALGGGGGALAVDSGEGLTVQGGEFRGNLVRSMSLGLGAGLYLMDTPANVSGVTFEGNNAAAVEDGGGGQGGAVLQLWTNRERAAPLAVSNCSFTGNIAFFAGALYCDGMCFVDHSSFDGNEARGRDAGAGGQSGAAGHAEAAHSCTQAVVHLCMTAG